MRGAIPLVCLAALTQACDSTPAQPSVRDAAAVDDLPGVPLDVDLGPKPLTNPLDLFDVMIDAPPKFDAVAKLDDQVVTTRDLELQSGGPLSKVYLGIDAARDDAWRTLLERAAFERLARKAGKPAMQWLNEQAATLPAPTDRDLAPLLASADVASFQGDERRLVAISAWRWSRWEVLRSVLVRRGLDGMEHKRLQPNIWNPSFANPATVIARLDGRDVTRGEIRALAGLREDQARSEYFTIVTLQLDKFVQRTLREREAQRLGITVEELVKRAVDAQPPVTAAAVADFIRKNPQYAKAPDGQEAARDNVARLRTDAGEKKLDDRLKTAASLETYVHAPVHDRFDVKVPAPRVFGDPSSPHTVVALYSTGCDVCNWTSPRVRAVVNHLGAQAHLVSGDYFMADPITSYLPAYRNALALQCAASQSASGWWKMFDSLADDPGKGDIAGLAARAAATGLDGDAMRACLRDDRLLASVFEDVTVGKRLGLQMNAAGIFVDGLHIADLGAEERTLKEVDGDLAPGPRP
jgi:hypothetical protein